MVQGVGRRTCAVFMAADALQARRASVRGHCGTKNGCSLDDEALERGRNHGWTATCRIHLSHGIDICTFCIVSSQKAFFGAEARFQRKFII